MKPKMGIARLAATLASLAPPEQGPAVELGIVQADGSVRVDGFSIPIPTDGYLLARHLKGSLEPGDRVVCVWAGSDLVVLDVVVTP